MQPERQQPPPSTTVLAHSCSPCASHSTAASAHVAAELSIQVRGAKVLCDGDALPSEGSLLQIEWQLWLRWQQRTTPNAAPAERCRASFDKPRREVHAGTTRRAPNIELQPRPSFQDKSRAGSRRGRRPPCGNDACVDKSPEQVGAELAIALATATHARLASLLGAARRLPALGQLAAAARRARLPGQHLQAARRSASLPPARSSTTEGLVSSPCNRSVDKGARAHWWQLVAGQTVRHARGLHRSSVHQCSLSGWRRHCLADL